MTVYNLVKQQVDRTPDSIAIRYEEKFLNYYQLDIEIDKMAAFLSSLGIGKGNIVGICVNRSIEMVIALLGIIKIGAVYLPLDPSFPVDRLKYMLDNSSCQFLLTQRSLIGLINAYDGIIIELEKYRTFKVNDNNYEETSDSDLAYILYTSGSTGTPKGVKIVHRGLNNFLLSMKERPGITSSDSLLAVTTLSFDISGLEIYLPLIVGATLVIAAKDETKDGRQLLAKMNQVSVMQATPSTWKLLVESGWESKLNLKALCGGEPLPLDLADKLLDRVDELWNMYGPTETTIWSSCSRVEKDKPVHLGKPIKNTSFYIVDNDNHLCAPGVPGELLIGGDGLSTGYLNSPDLTTEKFIVNPFDKEEKTKVYRTGDLVKLNNEYQIEFLGRKDEQVKIRGFRIEPGEIESLIRKNKFVEDSAVIVKNFNDDKKLVAFFTIKTNNDEKTTSEVINYWNNEWNFLYKTGIEKLESVKPNEDFDLDEATTIQLSNDQISIKEDINEWLTQTVNRIKELNPSRLLEIGCGGGHLLKKVAETCEFIAGTDIAESSVRVLEKQLKDNKEIYPPFRILPLPADADLPFESNTFDTIVINSVIQYFPDVDYLLKVINKSIDYLQDDGCLYIGDVQSHKLLRNYHLNDQLKHVSKSETVDYFLKLVDKRVQQEEELVIDPDFFYSLKSVNPRINRIQVKLRRGHHLNETTQYHYDVFIFLKKILSKESDSKHLFWNKDVKNINDLRKKLHEKNNGALFINDIPNKRLSDNLEREIFLEKTKPEEYIAVALSSFRSDKNDSHIDPEDLWTLADDMNLKVDLFIPGDSNLVKFDAVFYQNNESFSYPIRRSEIDFNSLTEFSNKPTEVLLNQNIKDQIRSYLEESLPEYMVPSFIIPLEKLPLTPNNKVDKKSLANYDLNISLDSTKVVLPETVAEKQLVKIWEHLLGIQGIGITDNFFELGGHSILAAQMFTEIEKVTGKRIPISTLFNLQTIKELARLIEEPEWTPDWSTLIKIKEGKGKFPLFLIHGAEGNILMYRELANHLDTDQPLYGIQSPGLNGTNKIENDIEAMSNDYIRAIKSVQPLGPYFLGGYCMGGTIAFEMAQQLLKNGDSVELLLLLETYNICISNDVNTAGNRIKSVFENIYFHVENLWSLKGLDRVAFFRSKLDVAQMRILAKSKHILQKFSKFFKNSNGKISNDIVSLTTINHSALNKYKPLPYPGKTILIKPSKNFSSEPDPDFGWKKLIEGEFKVYSLDLAPRGMLVEPYVIQTASIITDEINSSY